MVTILIIVYTGLVLVPFKLKLVKPRPYPLPGRQSPAFS